ncbi:MAG: hypothetical protein ACI9R8_001798, partial [Candidatus Paceibacteria bacterium]
HDKRLTTSMAYGGGSLMSGYINEQASPLIWRRV